MVYVCVYAGCRRLFVFIELELENWKICGGTYWLRTMYLLQIHDSFHCQNQICFRIHIDTREMTPDSGANARQF